MEDKKTDDIKSEVSIWLRGKHGMIGVILPEKRTTLEEWEDFYRALAIIAIRNTKIKAKEEAE